MFSTAFLKDAAERAIKTFAQALLSLLTVGNVVSTVAVAVLAAVPIKALAGWAAAAAASHRIRVIPVPSTQAAVVAAAGITPMAWVGLAVRAL